MQIIDILVPIDFLPDSLRAVDTAVLVRSTAARNFRERALGRQSHTRYAALHKFAMAVFLLLTFRR